ncbi:glycerol-3-phosphate dehydrogenase [Candidatus Bipolaricaulota bacterium]|nr:glycerol-3-phosphate dehydrogenase [Candidatus Bipolaricaulota bacterium]
MKPAESFTDEEFDLVVVGGGITGAGVARDAAIRGMDVALLEKDDFAYGTSSRSTKLVHGGLRYLENYDFGLVREALRERKALLDIASHLVYPSRFFFPVYDESRVFPLQLRAGLFLYDLLAGSKGIGSHDFIDPEETIAEFPGLKKEGLKATGVYYDCQMDDARLVISNVLDAEARGAKIANYAEVTGVNRVSSGDGWKLEVLDKLNEEEFAVRADKIVNATGPWSDDLAGEWRGEDDQFLRPTKGAHIILPALDTDVAGFFPSIHDDRLFFVIPWENRTLVGTTDTDFSGYPDDLSVNESDRQYLLSNINHYLEGVEFTESDVSSEFAGLRPLYSTSRGEVGESEVSRDHEILVEEDSIYTIIGGKYTTYRAMAEETLDLMGVDKKRSTAEIALPGTWEGGERESLKSELLAGHSLSEFQVERLLDRYGTKAESVLEQSSEFPGYDEPVGEEETPIKAQVYYSVTNELAREPEDVVRRRTSLFIRKESNKKAVGEIMEEMDGGNIEVERG